MKLGKRIKVDDSERVDSEIKSIASEIAWRQTDTEFTPRIDNLGFSEESGFFRNELPSQISVPPDSMNITASIKEFEGVNLITSLAMALSAKYRVGGAVEYFSSIK
jgi:hypothetical protein